MAQKLISVQDYNLIQSGIVKSLHKLQVPLWIDGQNVVFEDGQVRKSPGYIQIFNTPINEPPVMGLKDVLVGSTANLIFGDAARLYRYDGANVTVDGSGYSGSLDRSAFQESAFQSDAFVLSTVPRASLWSMESWGSWGLASNGIDQIQINKMLGAGFTALTGSPPTRAEVIVKYKIYLVAFNTDLGGAYIEWCDDDNVEDWANGAAGYIYVRDLDSDIVAACRMGEVIAFYSANSMGLVQYIGPDFYLGAKKVLEGIGAVGKFSIIEHNSQNYGISYQGIWRTDGTGYEYISPPLLREWLQDNVNWGQASKIAGYNNEDRSSLEWGLPLNGGSDVSVTLCYNHQVKTWTFKSKGITCGLKKNNFRFPIFGLSDGTIAFGEYTYDANGVPMDSWVQTRPMPSVDEMLWKDVEYFVMNLKSIVGTGFYVQLGFQENLDDEISWGDKIFPGMGSNPVFAPNGLTFGAGRYISLKLGSNEEGSNWRLAGFDLYGSLTGGHV